MPKASIGLSPRLKLQGGCSVGISVLTGLMEWLALHQYRRRLPAARARYLKHRGVLRAGVNSFHVVTWKADWLFAVDAGLPLVRLGWLKVHFVFPHRAFAALAAIAVRFFGVKAAALAAPPFRPPKRPRATAAGFLRFGAGASVMGAWPVDSSMTRYASWFGSRGRVFERSSMMISVWQEDALCQAQ